MASASTKPPRGDLPESLRPLPPRKLPPGYEYPDEYFEDYWERGLARAAKLLSKEERERILGPEPKK